MTARTKNSKLIIYLRSVSKNW